MPGCLRPAMSSFVFSMYPLLLLSACTGTVSASSFLSRAQGEEPTTIDTELQITIMDKIEEMLGKDEVVTDGRLARIEDSLRTTFRALPKNDDGKLEHAAVRYSLHSYFVQRHGWYVRGLSDVGEAFDGASSSGVLQDRVEEFIQGVFEQRLGAHGLDLRQTAILAATFENLVHAETVERMNSALAVLELSDAVDLTVSDVDAVMDTYMMSYILKYNFSEVYPSSLHYFQDHIHSVYPAFGETREFLRSVRAQEGQHKQFFSRADVEELLGRVGDQYGHFQNRECNQLKHMLLSLEDRSFGTNGSGRVRMADFYGSVVDAGNWQFSESKEYLEQLGVVDTHDPKIPRVIIPNYINSPSNCLAGSKYYSVCCINECESLLDALEHRFERPSVSPGELVEAVESLASSTVSADRKLHPILKERLEEIANHHGGRVPLHGRLFAQWMHHAYPRECPYPHLSGTVQAHKPLDFMMATQTSPTHTKEAMPSIAESYRAEQALSELDLGDECTVWSSHEELYVQGSVAAGAGQTRTVRQTLRPMACLALVLALSGMLARSAFAASTGKASGLLSGGKDLFV